MGLFSSMNGSKKFDFELDEKLPVENYRSMKEIEGIYILKSLYKNTNSKYGEHYVALAEKDGEIFGINLPKFMNDTIIGILQNEAMIAAINAGKCGISRSDLMSGANGDYYTVVWHDMDEESGN